MARRYEAASSWLHPAATYFRPCLLPAPHFLLLTQVRDGFAAASGGDLLVSTLRANVSDAPLAAALADTAEAAMAAAEGNKQRCGLGLGITHGFEWSGRAQRAGFRVRGWNLWLDVDAVGRAH